MRRIALACAVVCLGTTGAVARGQVMVKRPAVSHVTRDQHVKPRPHTRGPRPKKTHPAAKHSSAATQKRKATNVVARLTDDPALFGDQQVESTLDDNPSGLAEAFPFTGHITGQAHSINIYLDAHNKTRTLLAAIYAGKDGHPGTRLAVGSLPSPSPGPGTRFRSLDSRQRDEGLLDRDSRQGWHDLLRDRSDGPCQT